VLRFLSGLLLSANGALGLVTVNLTGNPAYGVSNLAEFSSQGPTSDGRIKPDVVV
jgi:hypothetical protein